VINRNAYLSTLYQAGLRKPQIAICSAWPVLTLQSWSGLSLSLQFGKEVLSHFLNPMTRSDSERRYIKDAS
jgi:hypothetical protein